MAKATKTPPASGITKELFPSGKVSAEVPYKKGVREGAGRMFYETGELYAKESYKAASSTAPPPPITCPARSSPSSITRTACSTASARSTT